MFESWELYMNKASVMFVKVRSNKTVKHSNVNAVWSYLLGCQSTLAKNLAPVARMALWHYSSGKHSPQCLYKVFHFCKHSIWFYLNQTCWLFSYTSLYRTLFLDSTLWVDRAWSCGLQELWHSGLSHPDGGKSRSRLWFYHWESAKYFVAYVGNTFGQNSCLTNDFIWNYLKRAFFK